MNTATDSEVNPEITVRQLPAGPTADTPRYWFDDDPFLTHFFNAISSMFPEGERFFIRCVRHYKDQISSPAVREQVAAFVQQEAQHFREHDSHVEVLAEQGFSLLPRLNKFASTGLNFVSSRFPRYALASTVGTEHITAVFADRVLARDDLWLAPMSDDMRPLWTWHAIEETEHKGVAFDVYQDCIEQGKSGGLWLRRMSMSYVLVVFFLETFVRHCYLLVKDGQFRPRVLWRGFRQLWGANGLCRSWFPDIWQFYRADFHPWQNNNAGLLAQSLERLRSDGFANA